MLVNLMPPVEVEPILREPTIVVVPTTNDTSVVIHPRYQQWLSRCGLTSVDAILNLPGEVVSGHPNRHVVQVKIHNRTLFLKREHAVGWRVRWRNWLDGFGWVSRSEREAKTLRQLEERGLPAPHIIAQGEDAATGRAFLMVDELVGYQELRDRAADPNRSPHDRRATLVTLAAQLATIHAAGFSTPELAAKHIFLRGHSPVILDWQSSRPLAADQTVPRLESLAHLNASLAEWLATPRERLRFLFRYLKQSQLPLEFRPTLEVIASLTQKLRRRSSIREQCQPNNVKQRLVWLEGEQVCAVPEVAKSWAKPAVCEPFYTAEIQNGERLSIRLADERPATLLRFRTTDPLGRSLAAVRGNSWRSPAAKLSRILFALQKAGVDVPQLYAFGQRFTTIIEADSFLVHDLPTSAMTLETWLGNLTNLKERRRLLTLLGSTLRTMHDANCLVGSVQSFRIVLESKRIRMVVDPTHDGQRVRNCDDEMRRKNLVQILRSFATQFTKADCMRLLRGYEPAKDAAFRKSISAIFHQMKHAR